MTILRTLLLASLLLSPACKGTDNPELARRCERAIAKVSLDELQKSGDPSSKPDREEQAIIDSVRKASQARCESEGLTVQQAACFDNIKDVETLFMAADCPAIADNKPSWFSVPPPDMRRKTLEQLRARREAEAGANSTATP